MAEECEKRIKELSPEQLDAFIETVKEVYKRTSYGIREELVKRDNSAVLMWSNGSRKWTVIHPDSPTAREAKKAGTTIELDANMIVVPFDYETVKKFADCLPPLPLYYCSFEAKMRGEVQPEMATLCWALKQLERALEEKWRERYK